MNQFAWPGAALAMGSAVLFGASTPLASAAAGALLLNLEGVATMGIAWVEHEHRHEHDIHHRHDH